MKIIRTSNYDYDDARGNQFIVADNIPHEHYAEVMCKALNESRADTDWFKIVPDDYVLPEHWTP